MVFTAVNDTLLQLYTAKHNIALTSALRTKPESRTPCWSKSESRKPGGILEDDTL
uniref:Uncharacterized protein n=1 Tax=Arundo donax TaxID=35708 RepID=A0A0A9G3P0_ARUDO